MITVSREHYRQIQYLIEQSKLGNHVLFDLETLRRVLRKPKSPSPQIQVDECLETLFALPSLAQQRAYLERLPGELFERVLQAYFQVIESNLLESMETRH